MLEAVATAVFAIYVAWPFLSLNQYVTAYDTITYGGPQLAFTFKELRAGHLPTWNDGIFAGVPHLANAQTAPFYPVKLLFLPFEVGRALELITAANILLLAAGTLFLLSRRLKLAPPAGFIGTAAVVGGGLIMARSTQFEQMAVVTWLPWLLAAIDWGASQERIRPRAIAAIAIPTGLMLVAGHPNQVYVCLPFVAIWSVVRVADHRRRRTTEAHADAPSGQEGPPSAGTVTLDIVRRFVVLGLGAMLGVGLAAAQLLVLAGQLNASVNSSGRSLLGTNNPELLLTPNFIPSALLGQTWSNTPGSSSGAFEATGFVGMTVCLLALLGVGVLITRRGGRWTAVGLGGAAILGVLLSVGGECHLDDQKQRVCEPGGKVFRFFFENVPGFDQARVPGRWILLTAFALAILAAFAVDAVVRRSVRVNALVVGGSLAALCLITIVLTPIEHNDDIGASYRVWIIAGVLTLGAIVAATLLARSSNAGRIVVAATAVLAVLVVVELGPAQLQSAARQSLTDQPFTALGGPTSEFLRQRPERNLSLTGSPPDKYAYLSDALRPNTNLTFGSRSLDGYDGGLWVTKRWVNAVEPLGNSVFNNDLTLTAQIESPPNRELLARYGVKYIIVDAKGTAEIYGIPNPSSPESQAAAAKIVTEGYKGPILIDGPFQIFENPNYTAEGQVYFNTIEVPQDADSVIRKLGEVRPDQAIVPPGTANLQCSGACPSKPVELERPRPGEINASVDLKQKGLFVVPEQHATGWTATVDGAPATIIDVDSMSQGIVLEPGQHVIKMTYQAPGLKSGLVLGVLSLIIVALCLWEPSWLRLPHRRTTGDADGSALATPEEGDEGQAGDGPTDGAGDDRGVPARAHGVG